MQAVELVDSETHECLRWLGMLDDRNRIPAAYADVPIVDAFCGLLEEKLAYEEHERDMVLMRHDFSTSLLSFLSLSHFFLSLLFSLFLSLARTRSPSFPLSLPPSLSLSRIHTPAPDYMFWWLLFKFFPWQRWACVRVHKSLTHVHCCHTGVVYADGRPPRDMSSLLLGYGKENGDTCMALTVGLTIAVGAQLQLDGKIKASRAQMTAPRGLGVSKWRQQSRFEMCLLPSTDMWWVQTRLASGIRIKGILIIKPRFVLD